MPKNIELKLRVDSLSPVLARAESLATEPAVELDQRDTFFETQVGRLKLREFGDGTAELIYYQRPDSRDPAPSEYHKVGVEDPRAALAIFGRLGAVRGVVSKRRTVLLIGRTRIHLDLVEGLGRFVELEVVLAEGESEAAGHAEAERVVAQLGLGGSTRLSEAYIDLLERSP